MNPRAKFGGGPINRPVRRMANGSAVTSRSAADDWGKEQVDRQKRREEILASRPRDKDRGIARDVKDFKEHEDFYTGKSGNEKRAKEYTQARIPDAPIPFPDKNPEDELKFNPDKMSPSEENDANLRKALAQAREDMPELVIRKAKEKTPKEKAKAEKAMREGSENEARAPFKKGGKVDKKSKDKNWIAKAIKKPGSLRKTLKVKEGEKIPAKKLATAAKKPGKTGQRARLAQTLKGFSKGGGIESRGKTRCKIC